MVASIGKIALPSQGVTYYERDGYYATDDPAHREASAWAGKGVRCSDCSPMADQAFSSGNARNRDESPANPGSWW